MHDFLFVGPSMVAGMTVSVSSAHQHNVHHANSSTQQGIEPTCVPNELVACHVITVPLCCGVELCGTAEWVQAMPAPDLIDQTQHVIADAAWHVSGTVGGRVPFQYLRPALHLNQRVF